VNALIEENNIINNNNSSTDITILENDSKQLSSLPFLTEEYQKVLNEELNKPLQDKFKSVSEKSWIIKVYGDVHSDLKNLRLRKSESLHYVIRRLIDYYKEER
jgi:hypothetical protein